MTIKSLFVIGFAAAFFLLLSCAVRTEPEKTPQPKGIQQTAAPLQAWERKWQETLNGAKQETNLQVYSTHGAELRKVLGEAFKKKYGISSEWTPGTGTELSEKILRERRANLHIVDIYVAGSTTPLTRLKPAGVLDPLEAELVLPDVTDPSKWRDGALPWVDKDHYILAPAPGPASSVLINLDLVNKEDVSSYMDLLNPRWKGKITITNPVRPGASGKWASVIGSEIMGWDFMRGLAKQEPVIAGDNRSSVEWVAKGKSAIALGPSAELVMDFKSAGARIELIVPREGTYLVAGNSPISVVNKRPHPSSARAFINWYLSKEGQDILAKYDIRQSSRLDASTEGLPDIKLIKPGVKYFNSEREDFLSKEPEYLQMVREIFGPLVQ